MARGIDTMIATHRAVGLRNTRRVWAAMSANPLRHKGELMRELGMPRRTFYTALTRLEAAGYIRHEGRAAWVVVVPFYVRERRDARGE